MEMTQGVHRARQFRGDATATICAGRRTTWYEFTDKVARVGGVMQTFGVQPDDRVAILSMNSDRFMMCLYGIPWGGGALVPLNFRLSEDELLHILTDCQPRVIFVDPVFEDLLRSLQARYEGFEHVVFMEAPDQEADHLFDELLAQTKPIVDVRRGGDDLLAIFYTGGTTGMPKGVMLSHDNIVHFALGFLTGSKMDENVVHLAVAPMFHMSCIGVFFTTLVAGTHVVMAKYEPEIALKMIDEHKVTHCLSVPIMIEQMLFHPNVEKFDISSLRMLGYGASPMPHALLDRAQREFPNIQYAQGYGMTEAPGFSYLGPEFHDEESKRAGRIRSAGRAITSCEMMIVDEHDNELPVGKTGEILARGPVVMKGYWRQPELTEEALRGGWMHTGDVGHMDERGFVYITDRIKDMIITGGENVFSTEVENALYRHDAVARCAVIGIPHDKWGEAVHAIVELKPGASATEDEIIEHCQTSLGGYKVPRSVTFSAKPLPLSAAGKILKAQLRKPYWSGTGRKL